ncbi:MAG: hypothetical protein BWX49_01725 [Bacteroidetes bacterium ADurb.Bin008]|jgi:hypothetical protein|nr:MAG: hypothetical protein BWX49_01725 [Bacteroidetes bacterium ADurb.Bin008]
MQIETLIKIISVVEMDGKVRNTMSLMIFLK